MFDDQTPGATLTGLMMSHVGTGAPHGMWEAVPEPSALTLSLLPVLFALRARRHRHP